MFFGARKKSAGRTASLIAVYMIFMMAGTLCCGLPFIDSGNDVYAASSAKAVKKVEGSELSSSEFETWMSRQGFPSSYKAALRKLHEAHPKWVFYADNTGLKWSSMLSKEQALGNNLVDEDTYEAWKSFKKGAYDFSDMSYTVFDASWNQACNGLIKYYLDPRNFLTEGNIYQFMDQRDATTHSESTIKGITDKYSKCFMNSHKTQPAEGSYSSIILNAANGAGVNANAVAAMIIMEQGWTGSSDIISGTYTKYHKKYYGIYNFFNIGAYSTKAIPDKIHRGLWWAGGQSGGLSTSYARPWNTRTKAIMGGALYYKMNYLDKNQYNYYTKKFNVMNGYDAVADHEYMTNVDGACSEGVILSYAYRNNDDLALKFRIPVYSSMPSSACKKPGIIGSNNDILKSLKIDTEGCSISPAFDQYTTKYFVTVPAGTAQVKITARAYDSNAKITGAGTKTLTKSGTKYTIKVTSTSGAVKKYYLTVYIDA